jgi:hypothetical protein
MDGLLSKEILYTARVLNGRYSTSTAKATSTSSQDSAAANSTTASRPTPRTLARPLRLLWCCSRITRTTRRSQPMICTTGLALSRRCPPNPNNQLRRTQRWQLRDLAQQPRYAPCSQQRRSDGQGPAPLFGVGALGHAMWCYAPRWLGPPVAGRFPDLADRRPSPTRGQRPEGGRALDEGRGGVLVLGLASCAKREIDLRPANCELKAASSKKQIVPED